MQRSSWENYTSVRKTVYSSYLNEIDISHSLDSKPPSLFHDVLLVFIKTFPLNFLIFTDKCKRREFAKPRTSSGLHKLF